MENPQVDDAIQQVCVCLSIALANGKTLSYTRKAADGLILSISLFLPPFPVGSSRLRQQQQQSSRKQRLASDRPRFQIIKI